MIRGVILDVDGTLVLSNDAHAWANVQAFAEAGFQAPFEQIRPFILAGARAVYESPADLLARNMDSPLAVTAW